MKRHHHKEEGLRFCFTSTNNICYRFYWLHTDLTSIVLLDLVSLDRYINDRIRRLFDLLVKWHAHLFLHIHPLVSLTKSLTAMVKQLTNVMISYSGLLDRYLVLRIAFSLVYNIHEHHLHHVLQYTGETDCLPNATCSKIIISLSLTLIIIESKIDVSWRSIVADNELIWIDNTSEEQE